MTIIIKPSNDGTHLRGWMSVATELDRAVAVTLECNRITISRCSRCVCSGKDVDVAAGTLQGPAQASSWMLKKVGAVVKGRRAAAV